MAAKVRVQAVEVKPDGEHEVILEIDVHEFTQGAQFGELSDAINYAQRLVKAAAKLGGQPPWRQRAEKKGGQ